MRKLFRRVSALLHRRRMERQLADEMATHQEMMPANRRRNFGSTLRLQEEAADQWGFAWLDQLRQDLKYAFRSLRRAPGFALTAIGVLSLGIGVNLAEVHMFRALTHPLRVRNQDSLRQFLRVSRGRTDGSFSVPAIEFYRRYNTVLSAVIAETDLRLYHAQDSDAIYCGFVSGNYFAELGIAPVYGRLLDQRDEQAGAAPVAVLAYDYWQSRFGGDPGILLKTITLNEKPVQVIGIAPAEFGGLVRQPTPVWMPLSQYPYPTGDGRLLADYGMYQTAMVGRLLPGISVEAAETQFRALTAELRKQRPESAQPDEWLTLRPVGGLPWSGRSGPTPAPIVLLLTACVTMVLLVLFSACANLGNMLLARGLARQREIEIRLAIGAGRWRLVRQLLTENLLLAALASVAALVVGKLAARLIFQAVAAPPHLRIVTDWTVVAACAGLGLLAILAFGLAPALQAIRRGPVATRARKLLVSVQVAASCVLLILSAFFVRAIRENLRIEVTFDYAGMTVVEPAFGVHNFETAQTRQVLADLITRLRQVPGIDAASIVSIPPLRGRAWVEHLSGQTLYLNAVDSAYFPMMRLPVLAGRLFGPGDPDTAVVSQSAARRLWPNESPLGKSFPLHGQRTVIGVVPDSGANIIGANPTSGADSIEVYFPLSAGPMDRAAIVVHSTRNLAQMVPAIRSATMLPGIMPLVSTMQSNVTRRMEAVRMTAEVLASLGAVASLLALIGIFGLLAFTVSQRTREIGVRVALGARGVDVLRVVVGQFALPFGTGAAFGVALAAAIARVLRHTLFGFMPFDVLSFGAGLLVFAAVALAASIAPARRALRIDPASALRYE